MNSIGNALNDKLDRKFLISQIKDGKFENKLEEFYQLFKSDDNEVKFELYKSIRKYPKVFDIPLLSKVLELPENIVFEIFQSDYKVSYFPVYSPNRNKAKLSQMIVIELKKHDEPVVLTNDKDIKKAVETIKKITQKNFFVIFGDNFKHNSFMLALYAALNYPQETLNRYAFTGVIGNDRDIYEVEAIDEKRKVAEEKRKKLISPKEVREIEELDFWIGRKHIPVPFIQLANKDVNKALNDLVEEIHKIEKYLSLENLKNIYDICPEDITLHYPDFLPLNEEFWTDYINKEFEPKIRKILDKAGKTVVFHISTGITSLAFGLGVKFGSRQPCILYHYQPGKDKVYYPVLNLEDSESLRSLKEIKHNVLKNPEYCDITIPESDNYSEVALAIHLASHPLYSDVENYLKENGKNMPVIGISLKDNQGKLPVNEDWKKYVVEINSIITKLRDDKKISKFHLFMSAPTVIGFALGMAIGHVINVPVYSLKNKDAKPKEKYEKVFETQNIASPF
ncbi:SAVED domain-containing protein [Persephonella sp. KM09-Lau-8]|uniref:SAVED domain-containing protein n=1 Tax=Persephonella sp. KM09-Lau-8 TaxID=1158345 RepID=UPI000497D7D9|nr:SAVED domain-containing protein [Persephonella sp. KM09-Lau-8]